MFFRIWVGFVLSNFGCFSHASATYLETPVVLLLNYLVTSDITNGFFLVTSVESISIIILELLNNNR